MYIVVLVLLYYQFLAGIWFFLENHIPPTCRSLLPEDVSPGLVAVVSCILRMHCSCIGLA